MAFKGIEVCMFLVLVALLSAGAKAQAQSGCTNVLTNLSPCLNYITGNSSTPSSTCCTLLSNAVQTSPQCLCSVLNGGGASMGIKINQTLALSLPSACNVQTPPVSRCKAGSTTSGTPSAGSPTSSPADSSNETPEGAITPASDIPSGTGSKTTPSIEGGSSDGSVVKAPFHFVLLLVFIMSCASTITSF